MKRSIPIYNGTFYEETAIRERFLYQLSDMEDQEAAQMLEVYLQAEMDVEEIIEKTADCFGLARVKNVLERWKSNGLKPEQYYGLAADSFSNQIVNMAANVLEELGEQINKIALKKVCEIKERMEEEIKYFGKELDFEHRKGEIQDIQEISEVAHRLGCYLGLLEYVKDYQVRFEEWITAVEIEEIEYFWRLKEPLKEIYEEACGAVSFIETVGKSIDSLINKTQITVIKEKI